MQAIVTKSLGPTERFGDRVKATAQSGSLTLENDDRLHIEENHKRAATALANKFGWLDYGTELVGGGTPDGNFCWVFAAPQKSAAMGDWRDVVIDALQSYPDDLERSARRALSVINTEIGEDDRPLGKFTRMGAWDLRDSTTITLDDIPALEVSRPQVREGRDAYKLKPTERAEILEVLVKMLNGHG